MKLCDNCLFKSIYQDMGAVIETCGCVDSLPQAVKAVDACHLTGECKYHLSKIEAMNYVKERIQNEI